MERPLSEADFRELATEVTETAVEVVVAKEARVERRRVCVRHVQGALGVSERRACRTLGQPRSTQRRGRRVRGDEVALTEAIVALASEYGRYGYRRITALLRADGWRVNAQRVKRVGALPRRGARG